MRHVFVLSILLMTFCYAGADLEMDVFCKYDQGQYWYADNAPTIDDQSVGVQWTSVEGTGVVCPEDMSNQHFYEPYMLSEGRYPTWQEVSDGEYIFIDETGFMMWSEGYETLFAYLPDMILAHEDCTIKIGCADVLIGLTAGYDTHRKWFAETVDPGYYTHKFEYTDDYRFVVDSDDFPMLANAWSALQFMHATFPDVPDPIAGPIKHPTWYESSTGKIIVYAPAEALYSESHGASIEEDSGVYGESSEDRTPPDLPWESDFNGEVACNDGVDNDGNGLIDCEDPYCDLTLRDYIDQEGGTAAYLGLLGAWIHHIVEYNPPDEHGPEVVSWDNYDSDVDFDSGDGTEDSGDGTEDSADTEGVSEDEEDLDQWIPISNIPGDGEFVCEY